MKWRPVAARAAGLLLASWAAAARASPPACDVEALAAAAQADTFLRTASRCDQAALMKLAAGVRALDGCAGGPVAPAGRWIFPVAGVKALRSIGGVRGNGYQRARRIECYASAHPGHPAHDLFVHDPSHTSRDRQGNPYLVRAVEEGFVLVAHVGWTPGTEGKGGNYVMLYLPASKQIAYYAHLETVQVVAGQRVRPGETLGTVGRTGTNAWRPRSPTHLHFGLWNAATFLPVDSYPWLVGADDR